MWLAAKPSLRAASCCSVEVVKGGGGFFENGLVSTEATVKRPASTTALASSASLLLPIVSRSIFLPSSWTVYRPTWVDLSLLGGSLSFFVFMFLLFLKLVPFIPITELKEMRHEIEEEKHAA